MDCCWSAHRMVLQDWTSVPPRFVESTIPSSLHPLQTFSTVWKYFGRLLFVCSGSVCFARAQSSCRVRPSLLRAQFEKVKRKMKEAIWVSLRLRTTISHHSRSRLRMGRHHHHHHHYATPKKVEEDLLLSLIFYFLGLYTTILYFREVRQCSKITIDDWRKILQKD